jgi:hypothetical protein
MASAGRSSNGVGGSALALSLALLAGGAHSATTWSRGDYSTLTFTYDFDANADPSYTIALGDSGVTFGSVASALAAATGAATRSGSDATLGKYDELSLSFADNASLAVRYFSAEDAFVFLRFPNARCDGKKSNVGGIDLSSRSSGTTLRR